MLDRKQIWKSFSIFQSATNSQKYLKNYYEAAGLEQALSLSYENSYTFIYYLEHGKTYYHQAKNAPLSIQPVLLFYGMVQLLKACVLLEDPHYPASTSVLAHGVTTRKRKKKNYEFLEDEVKIQRDGLFSYFTEKMFHMKQLENERFTMRQLLKQIPELSELFSFQKKQPYQYMIGSFYDKHYYIPEQIIDQLKMNTDRFIEYVKLKLNHHPIDTLTYHNEAKYFTLTYKHTPPVFSLHPLQYNFDLHTIHIPAEKQLFQVIPELPAHFLLLYNLSMICRYETEWWNDLLHNYETSDFPFIQQFLTLTSVKVPYLIYSYLHDKGKH